MITDILRLILEPLGYEIQTTNSSPQGVVLAQQWEPDIIIMDLMMPTLDGWSACRKIREFSQVPVLILSVITNPAMVAQALDSGADDILSKPISADMLVAHINKLLRRSHPTIRPSYRNPTASQHSP
jgi:DNA-binding response OmpR family regulator